MFKKMFLALTCFLVMVSISFAGVETFQYNSSRTEANDINDNGIVAGFKVADDETRTFTYKDGIFTLSIGGTFADSQGDGINNNNVMIGYTSGRTGVYDIDLQTWDYLPYPGPFYIGAYQHMMGINDSGLMVGQHNDTCCPAQHIAAVIYENGTFVEVNYLDYDYGSLSKVNNNREAVGCFWSGAISPTYPLTNVLVNIHSNLTYTVTPLNLPSQAGIITQYTATAINDSGDVYGLLIQNGVRKAFKFNIHTEDFNIVFTQDDISSSAVDLRINGVNNLGQVVGWYTDTGSAVDRIGYIFTPAPTGTITIDGGSDYCTTRDVSLTIDSADADYMQFSNDGVSYSVWEPYAASKDWLLSAGEGVKTVYVTLKNEAENVSTLNDTIVLDSTAPTGNLTINDGNNYSATDEVTLTLNTDNAAYMCFSNDGINYSDWETYSDTKTWTLSEGDGTKTVYVKYKDQAGNTFVVSHSIILDSIAPDMPVLIVSGVINNNQPTLDWEVINGTDYYILEYADNPNFDFSTLVDAIGPSEYGLETPLNDGTWYWRVMAVDFAGNESQWSAAGVFTIDTREHCIGGPETPILLSPANGAANVSLTPVLSIQEPIDTPLCNYPLKFRWRISKDPDFQGLVAQVNSESKDLTSYQLSELILDPSTTYYWKVRIIGSQGNNSEWSNVFSFTTQPPAGDDVNDNGIPDDQEVDDGDDLDGDGTADNEQDVEIKSFKSKEGNVKLGMRSSNSDLKCIKALYTDSVDDYGNKPDQVLYGLWSYRVEVEQYGATVTIKIFLSEPAPKNSKVVFHDSLDGWQDFSDHVLFNDTRTEIEIEVKDGGYGDNDHTENKVIVDPGGVGIFGAGSSSGDSSGSGGCFINTVIPW